MMKNSAHMTGQNSIISAIKTYFFLPYTSAARTNIAKGAKTPVKAKSITNTNIAIMEKNIVNITLSKSWAKSFGKNNRCS